MGTAPGRRPLARSSGSCPGWAATGLAAVTLAICVSSAVPPLLAPIVTRAYGRRGCQLRLRGCQPLKRLQGVLVATLPQGVSPSAQRVKEETRKVDPILRLRSSLPSCRLAVLPSCRLAVLPSCRLAVLPSCRLRSYRLTMFVANHTR